ncbi:endosperm defective 1-like protein [Tanacetum coccineum]
MSNVTTVDQGGGAPPLPHRRPRVREVSSRFMSPAPSSSSTPDLHSVNRPKHSPAPERSLKPSPSPSQRRLLLVRTHEHENHSENIPETVRSMDFRKPRVKLFKENESSNNQIPKSTVLRTNKSTRPAPGATCDRIVPSRFMLPHRQTQTDAANLLRLSGLSFSSAASTNDTLVSQPESESTQGGSCPNSPISSQQNRTWPLPNTTDDNTLSARLFIRTSSANCPTSSKFYTPSLCSRSLNFQPSQNSFKTSGDTSVCKPPIAASIGAEKENRNLPPQPGGNKAGVDLRKGKKAQCSQEEVHSLKMLHNHYLLWRYANAKAQASIEVQRTEIEKQFFSVGTDISHLRDTVKKKQAELAVLQRIQALSTIVEAQANEQLSESTLNCYNPTNNS